MAGDTSAPAAHKANDATTPAAKAPEAGAGVKAAGAAMASSESSTIFNAVKKAMLSTAHSALETLHIVGHDAAGKKPATEGGATPRTAGSEGTTRNDGATPRTAGSETTTRNDGSTAGRRAEGTASGAAGVEGSNGAARVEGTASGAARTEGSPAKPETAGNNGRAAETSQAPGAARPEAAAAGRAGADKGTEKKAEETKPAATGELKPNSFAEGDVTRLATDVKKQFDALEKAQPMSALSAILDPKVREPLIHARIAQQQQILAKAVEQAHVSGGKAAEGVEVPARGQASEADRQAATENKANGPQQAVRNLQEALRNSMGGWRPEFKSTGDNKYQVSIQGGRGAVDGSVEVNGARTAQPQPSRDTALTENLPRLSEQQQAGLERNVQASADRIDQTPAGPEGRPLAKGFKASAEPVDRAALTRAVQATMAGDQDYLKTMVPGGANGLTGNTLDAYKASMFDLGVPVSSEHSSANGRQFGSLQIGSNRYTATRDLPAAGASNSGIDSSVTYNSTWVRRDGTTSDSQFNFDDENRAIKNRAINGLVPR